MGTLEFTSKLRLNVLKQPTWKIAQASDVVWALSAHQKSLAHHAPAAPHAYLKDPRSNWRMQEYWFRLNAPADVLCNRISDNTCKYSNSPTWQEEKPKWRIVLASAKLWLLCSFPPNVSSYCKTSPCCLEPGRKPPQIKPLCRSNQLNRRCCGRRRSTWPNGKFVSSKVVQVLSSNVHSPPGQHLGQKVRNYPTHFDVVVKWKPQLRKIIEKKCHRPLEKGQKFLFR